ncbi:MAG: efflux RND transporter periplasmic adaptor subunit [Nitrospirales bacterium]|nr:efflux RND transporter periplasmic adaptor subunit [Nitrospirales bacterium]
MKSPHLFLLSFLFVMALWSCTQEQEELPAPTVEAAESEIPNISERIETAEIRYSPSTPILTLAAKVDFGEDQYSKISSPLSGRVIEVRKKLGTEVKDGEILLIVDSPQISEAYAKFVQKASQVEYAQRAYDLAKDLYEGRASPLQDVKLAQNDLVKAIAAFRQTKSHLLSLKVPASELDKPIGQQQITSRFEIKSPLTGIVVQRNVTPGQVVENDPPAVLMTVANLERLQVEADLYEKDISLVKPNQKATVTVSAYPDEKFPALIAMVGDVVDPKTRTVKVRAWVNNDEQKLKPEMYAELQVEVSDSPNYLVIPQEAVLDINGKHFVYVVNEEGNFDEREVQVALIASNQMRVLKGLRPTERIVVKGAIFLKAMYGKNQSLEKVDHPAVP